MLVTITIPETEERTVALVQDLVTLLRKYPGVQMKTVTRPRLRFGEGKVRSLLPVTLLRVRRRNRVGGLQFQSLR
jgi:hypothetical protein